MQQDKAEREASEALTSLFFRAQSQQATWTTEEGVTDISDLDRQWTLGPELVSNKISTDLTRFTTQDSDDKITLMIAQVTNQQMLNVDSKIYVLRHVDADGTIPVDLNLAEQQYQANASYDIIDVETDDNIDRHQEMTQIGQTVEKLPSKPKMENIEVSDTEDNIPLKKFKKRKQTPKKVTRKEKQPRKKTKKPTKAKGSGKKKVAKIKKYPDELKMQKKQLNNEVIKLEDNVEQVYERLQNSCECGGDCFEGLDADKVYRHRLNIADLTKAEHDMYLMGNIMASMQNPEETCRHKERLRIRSTYAYQGKKVCLAAFLYLEHVSLYQMKRLRKHLRYHGVSARIHGNHGRKPSNTLPLDIYKQATKFVQYYIQTNSKLIKHMKNFTTTKKNAKQKIPNNITSYYLPAECNKKAIHEEYKKYSQSFNNKKIMKYSTFTGFLKKQFPNIKYEKKAENEADGDVKKKGSQVEAAAKNNAECTTTTFIECPTTIVECPTTTIVEQQIIEYPTTLVECPTYVECPTFVECSTGFVNTTGKFKVKPQNNNNNKPKFFYKFSTI